MNRFSFLLPALFIFGITGGANSYADSSLLNKSQLSPDHLLVTTAATPQLPHKEAVLQMATSPDGGALDLVLTVINSAKSSIRIASYAFTNKTIAKALVQKQQDGIDVNVVMDKSQSLEKFSSAPFLAKMGIPLRINSRYAIQHSKILIVDEETVETGSFNFTDAAAKWNSENVLVIWRHPALAKQFTEYWTRLWEESEPFEVSP